VFPALPHKTAWSYWLRDGQPLAFRNHPAQFIVYQVLSWGALAYLTRLGWSKFKQRRIPLSHGTIR
jgi:hypothetical protein